MSEVPFEPEVAQARIARGEGTAIDHHTVAVNAYRKGDHPRALAAALEAQARGIAGAAPVYLRGLVLREMGRLADAALALAEAAELAERDGMRAKALAALGTVRCLQGDPRAALDPLSRACELGPDMRETHHNLGVAAVRAREWEVAAQAFLELARSGAQEHYLRLLVDVGRAAALDEMRAQGHRLKNLIGLVGDKFQKLQSEVRAPAAIERADELARDVDQLYAGMKSYLEAMREEPLQLDLLDVNALVGRCLFALSTSFRDLKIERRLGERLPEIVADKESLEEALTNVVRNAIEALRERPPAATGEPDIQVSTRAATEGRVAIEVRDRGPGLDPDDVDRIFRLGFTTKPRGSGIGLAQVRKLIRAHGGEVEVEPNKGRGALFRLLLPTSPPPLPTLPRLDLRSPLFESLGDLVLGPPE